MRAGLLLALAGILAVMLLGPLAAAQNPPPASPPPPEQTAAPSSSPPAGQAAPAFTPEQLDQLTAPIALYPDPLVGQILMAATYPLEVVEADRWLQQPANAALKGDQLTVALAQQLWDASVKSLVAFPQILRMMDSNLTWTEQLGDAFLAAQSGVMDSVQRLRQKAEAAGKLQSTPQQTVSTDDGIIVIEEPNPNSVYVPVYDPNVAYGPWPYPDYPPDYFPGLFPGADIGPLGFGWWDVGIIAPLWGWYHWDWHHHRIDIDPHRFNAINPHQPPITSDVWQHDPSHRDGVPYRDPAVRARYQGAAAAATIRAARGFPVVAPAAPARPAVNTGAVQPRLAAPARPAAEAAPTVLHPAPPLVQSLGSGPEVRTQSARGQASRMSAPAPRPAVIAPAPRAPAPAPRFVPPAPRAAPVAHGGGEHR